MDALLSLREYPREDTAFRLKKSVNFQMIHTKIFDERRHKGLDESIQLWLAHGVLGVFVAFIAFLMHLCEDELIEFRMKTV